MVQTRKMNESFFAKLIKELTVAGELVRARQEEKQALLNQFDAECKRFFFGRISERALASSVKKTNRELLRLDKAINMNMMKAKKLSNRVLVLVARQKPVKYKAKLSGIDGGKKKVVKKKKVAKKKKPAKKKKVVKRKKAKKKR